MIKYLPSFSMWVVSLFMILCARVEYESNTSPISVALCIYISVAIAFAVFGVFIFYSNNIRIDTRPKGIDALARSWNWLKINH